MASDYQQYHTPPRQSIATSSIHSSAGDLGITITIDIMKVTFVGIRVVTVLKIQGQKKAVYNWNRFDTIVDRSVN